ncbi:MAG: aminopeptidase P family protein [Deltaproteobacteria bacterium]|nr:aminopeptidase P family protein [Deltaproteobacteria bacterium]
MLLNDEPASVAIVPEGEVTARLCAFKERLSRRGLTGALVQLKVDRFYLSGTAQDALLWVDAERDPVLWVLRDVGRARAETPVEVVPVRSRRELWSAARAATQEGRVGIMADSLSVAEFGRLNLSGTSVEDVSPDLFELRSRKSAWEVEQMEAAGRVAAAGYAYAAEVLREGMTEAELAGLLFAKMMSLGHEGLLRCRNFEAYPWHIVAGPNTLVAGANDSAVIGRGFTPAFPCGASLRPIRRGEPVMADFGATVFGYQTDQTRTICLGPAPEWLLEGHRKIEEVHAAAQRALRPGATAAQVFAAAEETAQALRLEGYLGPPERRCRFIGHGVGLETVESPILAQGADLVLDEGMTVAVEPKAVFSGLGGFGVEDTFLITRDGPRPFAPVPLELIVV